MFYNPFKSLGHCVIFQTFHSAFYFIYILFCIYYICYFIYFLITFEVELNSQIRGIMYSLHSMEDLVSKEVKGIPGKGIWFVLRL